ncbi:MAG: hypothetical protein GY829_01060 [Gammaproteobacteria bacterium]|nr:hypothetical protein [Gammaproteobacteria bacterium]
MMFLKSVILFFILTVQLNNSASPYLGQLSPKADPELFAPDIISDGLNNRDLAITPDGSEIYYSINMMNFELSTIMVIYQKNGQWSIPEVASFARDKNYKYLEPAISPDGSKFFFVKSRRGGGANDIWFMNRKGMEWGNPEKLGNNINTDVSETFPSITKDGTLYFSRADKDNLQIEHIYRSKFINGQYSEAEKLPSNVNSGQTQFNAFVAPDESYLIVSVYGREDSIGSIDYYIVYRNAEDEWSTPINMGTKINTASAQEYSAYVSRDNRYLFFMSTRLPSTTELTKKKYSYEDLNNIHDNHNNGNSDIYWMDTSIIEELRPEGF